MKAFFSHWNARKRYGAFVLWGLAHGAIVFAVLILLLPDRPSALLRLLMICVLGGGLLSAITFGVLLRAPHWLQPVGFIVIGTLMPYLAAIGITALDHSRIEFFLDPLTVLFTLLWTAYTIPSALGAAVIYFLICLIRRNPRHNREAYPEARP